MEWQPIETAPKNGTRVLLFCPKTKSVFGYWKEDKYSKHPKPYWTHDRECIFGIRATRADQPTHWMPQPEQPAI